MSFNYSPKIVTDGLVLCLDAANTKSYVNGSTAWRDLSRGGNNGTLINGPTFNSNNGGSIVFDGVNDYIEFGNVLNLGTNSMTVNQWLYFSNNNTTQITLSKALAGNQAYRFSTGLLNTGKLYTFIQGNGGADILPNGLTTITANTWVMATYIFDRTSSIKIYYNSVEETLTGAATISQWNGLNFQSINPFRIGTYTTANNIGIVVPMSGRIGLTQVYFKALSAQEILQNYNATKGRFGL
jgi:hypothetical protein